MSEDEADERTTWIPIAIAGGFVAAILAGVLLIDGSANDSDPESPSSPVSSATP